MTQLSDELLVAYVDGQLDTPQATAVGRLMREDIEVANRVRRLRESQMRLVEAFGGMMERGQMPEIEPSIRREISESQAGPGLSFKMIAITGSALVLFGVILGRVTAHPTAQAPRKVVERLEGVQAGSGWQGDIARLHSFFSRDTLSAKADSQSNIDAARFQLTSLVKAQIPLPDFSRHALTFNRAQAFNYQGGRLMQLVYLGKEEPPVALYVMAGGPDSPMNDATYGNVRVVSWAAGGAKLVLAGELPLDALKALAVVAQTQIAQK
jgi:anti-sigma factor RsiW